MTRPWGMRRDKFFFKSCLKLFSEKRPEVVVMYTFRCTRQYFTLLFSMSLVATVDFVLLCCLTTPHERNCSVHSHSCDVTPSLNTSVAQESSHESLAFGF